MKVKTNVDLDQLWLNFAKAYRANVRMKHALHADNEINATIGNVHREFQEQIKQGFFPEPPVFKAFDVIPVIPEGRG